jgi:hypothetical protein
MSSDTKTRAVAGLAAVVSGVMLIGTTGLTFAAGWVLWAAGLTVLLAAIPSMDEGHGKGGGAVTHHLTPPSTIHERRAA